MRLAVGRLRVSLGFSSSFEVERKTDQEKALAHAERSLGDLYPPKEIRSFGVTKVIAQDWWRQTGRLESRTATLLAERDAVLDVLDGKRALWMRVPHWRWHKRRMLEAELCRRNRIDKWW